MVRAGGQAAAARRGVSRPLRGRLRDGVCHRARCATGAGGPAEAIRQVRSDAAPREDAAGAVRPTAGKPHGQAAHGDQGPGTFDLLGFTHYWKVSRKGSWVIARKTAKSRLARAVKKIAQWCKTYRHLPVKEQHKALARKLRGHYAYYGITGNGRSLRRFRHQVDACLADVAAPAVAESAAHVGAVQPAAQALPTSSSRESCIRSTATQRIHDPEEPDAVDPARPDLWGAGEGNLPGLPDTRAPLEGAARRLASRCSAHRRTALHVLLWMCCRSGGGARQRALGGTEVHRRASSRGVRGHVRICSASRVLDAWAEPACLDHCLRRANPYVASADSMCLREQQGGAVLQPHPPPLHTGVSLQPHPPLHVLRTLQPHPPPLHVLRTLQPHPPPLHVLRTLQPHPPPLHALRTLQSHPPPLRIGVSLQSHTPPLQFGPTLASPLSPVLPC